MRSVHVLPRGISRLTDPRMRESEIEGGTLNTPFFTANEAETAHSPHDDNDDYARTRVVYIRVCVRACVCAHGPKSQLRRWRERASERERGACLSVRSQFLTYLYIFFAFPGRYFSLSISLSWPTKNRRYSSSSWIFALHTCYSANQSTKSVINNTFAGCSEDPNK